MNEFYFAEQLLLRAPARNWRQYFVDDQQHLEDFLLRSAIYVASPQFYEILEQKQFDVGRLSPKERLTLRKYINRSCYRAIPFGLFAGVTLLRWGEAIATGLPELRSTDIKLFPDQGWVAAISADLFEEELNEPCRYQSNPTLYKLLDEYRFVSTEIEPDGKARRYLLQSTDYTVILQELVYYCRTARSAPEIVGKICQLAGCTEEVGKDYYHFLKGEQFLVEECRPTITGPEYISSLLSLPEFLKSKQPRTGKLRRVLTHLKNHVSLDPDALRETNQQLFGLTNLRDNNNLYAILNRPHPSGALAHTYQGTLRDALSALECLQVESTIPAMEQFVRNFQKDFEGQTLDLLYALDPEVGIGYYAEEQPPNPLLETLQLGSPDHKDQQFNWTDAHRFLLNKWHSSSAGLASPVCLQEEDLPLIKRDSQRSQILGMSVLFRLANNQVYLESAGGVNAPALLGRFTIADEEITQAARKMAKDLEAANPQVIFAELLHLTGTHTDNINRRETIWSYEIPITAASTLPVEKQIALEDLRVQVVDGLIVLFSEKHGKMVIPRHTSAYNHTIDKLPLFRFLVDVSFQYGQFSLSLDLRQFFPGLSYYPRVTYKECILHLATWVLTEAQIKAISGGDSQSKIESITTFFARLGLPSVFSLMEGDQQLVFFRDNPSDQVLFSDCISSKQEVIIKEFLLQDDVNLAADHAGQASFVNQFNAYLLPEQPLRLPAPGPPSIKNNQTIRRLMPGSEWLYLKIYTSRNSSGKLLLKILPLLRRQYGGKNIKSWFFVRYEDHAPHIRLRIQMAPEDISLLLIAFKKELENGVSQHVIREYQIDVYNRELERYQAGNFGLTELFFWTSSELVIRHLKLQEQSETLPVHELAIRTTLDIITAFIPERPKQISFAEKSFRQYLAEFEGKRMKVELDQKYRTLTPVIRHILKNDDFYRANGLFLAGRKFLSSSRYLAKSVSQEDPRKDEFLQSIVHMHLNRLFVTEPRKQELVTYYLLYKFLLSDEARSRRNN